MNRIRVARSNSVVLFAAFVVVLLLLMLVFERGPRGRMVPLYCGAAYAAARSWSDTLLVDTRIPPTRSDARLACGSFRRADSLRTKHR